jgi:hypothetical protein
MRRDRPALLRGKATHSRPSGGCVKAKNGGEKKFRSATEIIIKRDCVLNLIKSSRVHSVSYTQRHLKISYTQQALNIQYSIKGRKGH